MATEKISPTLRVGYPRGHENGEARGRFALADDATTENASRTIC
jgi:hypothetical protein